MTYGAESSAFWVAYASTGDAVATRNGTTTAGVAHVLDTMRQELNVAMVLCGATDVAELDPSVLLDR